MCECVRDSFPDYELAGQHLGAGAIDWDLGHRAGSPWSQEMVVFGFQGKAGPPARPPGIPGMRPTTGPGLLHLTSQDPLGSGGAATGDARGGQHAGREGASWPLQRQTG